MDSCNECGNTSMVARQIDGVSVLECELCGAVAGSPAAVRRVLDARAARESGIAPMVFGVVRALRALGLHVDRSDEGDRARGRWPYVSWQLVDARGIVQVENLTKSLLLSARALAVPWMIEVEFRDVLVFVLRPRVGSAEPAETDVAAAQSDLAILQRAIDRDSRLSWWRHPGGGSTAAVGRTV